MQPLCSYTFVSSYKFNYIVPSCYSSRFNYLIVVVICDYSSSSYYYFISLNKFKIYSFTNIYSYLYL